MKTILRLVVVLLLCGAVIDLPAELSLGGIVYGPKAAFKIDAPQGWGLDNSSGAEDGLPCVLYRKGDTWENAEPLMYAKIAGTDVEEHEAFAKKAISEMKKQRGEYQTKRIEEGKTGDGCPYFVNEYSPARNYPRRERVAYIQLPKAVAYIVYSAEREAAFRKHQSALTEVLKSFAYMEVKPGGDR